ncbi:MAG TPA: hypothetical protein VJM50_07145 [Pyrinomonadaceae bacterium]|nr:hypothetical protein [Pyrinomonadaceae bacterium]
MDREEILHVLRAFESTGLEYVIIGAAAMGFQGLVRATQAHAAALRKRFSLKDEG